MIERKLINPISDDGLRGPVLVGELRSPLAEIWSDVAPKGRVVLKHCRLMIFIFPAWSIIDLITGEHKKWDPNKAVAEVLYAINKGSHSMPTNPYVAIFPLVITPVYRDGKNGFVLTWYVEER